MNFLHPGIAIAGAAAVALPIVIHLLFRRRRIPLDWAAMELLREAVRRMNRKLRLEQWTVLALRSLAVLCAGLGLAVPFLGESSVLEDRARTWMLVVDDGVTSGVRGAGGEAEIERIKDEAARVLADRNARDTVGIVLASSPPRVLLAPTGDAEQVARALEAIEPVESPSDLRAALVLARESIVAEGVRESNGKIVLASALRAGTIPPGSEASGDPATPASAAPGAAGGAQVQVLALVPARDAPVDVRVRSVEARPAPAGGTVAVRALLAREGGSLEEQSTDVRALGDGFAPSAPRRVSWQRGQAEAIVEFQLAALSAGASDARRAAIEVRVGDDALSAGNAGWTVVDVRSEVDVGVIGRRGTLDASDLDKVPASLWISRALSPSIGSGMRVRDIDPSSCDARALLGLDAVVIARPDLLSTASCDAVAAFVRSGGIAVVVPAGESRAQPWGGTLLPRLGSPFSVGTEAMDLAAPSLLAEEQPANRLLASIRPELASLVAPVTVSRVLPIQGHEADDVVLSLADGSPFVVAASPRSMLAEPSDGAGREDGRVEGGGTPNRFDARLSEPAQGLVVLFASAPELSWTNLSVKPLMVPLFQELVRTSLQISASRGNASVGNRVRAAPGLRLEGPVDASLVIGSDGASTEPVLSAGVLRGEDGSMIAVNHDNARLGLAPVAEDAVRTALRDFGSITFQAVVGDGAATSDAGSGSARADGDRAERAGAEPSRLAFLALVIALAALLFEGFLSRMFSHASLARAGTSGGVINTVGRVRPRAASAPTSIASSEVREPAGGRR